MISTSVVRECGILWCIWGKRTARARRATGHVRQRPSARWSDAVGARRYRRLSLKYHPDINKDGAAHEEFLRICEAYEVLSDGAALRSTLPQHFAGGRWGHRAGSAAQTRALRCGLTAAHVRSALQPRQRASMTCTGRTL
jgi:hypothetical protein